MKFCSNMGSASSKFKKYLQHGDEYAAMQIYQNNPEIRKTLEPSFSYGESHDHFTPLHYAAKHGMKHLIRAFLNDLDGNPNKTNAFRQTALHCVCQVNQQKSLSALERRSYSVILLLSWRGPIMSNGERERVCVSKQDDFGYTALHYAARSGLRKCVEYLVAHGADLFVENNDGLNPCDLAIKENHHQIALFLESKMVFSGTPESLPGDSRTRTSSVEAGSEEEVYSGLRAQDLQEAKDQLLVETADMLHIPLFTAEGLLRHAEWSREALLDKWIRDPVLTCRLAGVQPPCSVLRHSSMSQYEHLTREYNIESKSNLAATSSSFNVSIDTTLAEDEFLCEICCDLMDSDFLDSSELSCQHRFCTTCWKNYLHTKIQEGNAHQIFCPAFDCSILVPVDVIERHVSPAMARKYLTFDINAFVETNKSIRWCPFPGCNRAVNLPETERKYPESPGLPATSHVVDCGSGHVFCFECGGEGHAPIGCSAWRLWLSRCAGVDPSELKTSSMDYQDAANCLWLVTHSKPCPNCKSPIQKNDGCNHLKCSKCRFDFCWVCLEAWKKHSSVTGGYFRCNRFNAINSKLDEGILQVNRLSDKTKKLREMNRFVHFYTRYKNHDNSRKMEESLLHSVKKKREILQSSLLGDEMKSGSLGRNTKFYEDGVWELLKSRQILACSYVYGFYLEDHNGRKTVFEFMQNELEEVTERLSEMIARPYLRTPRKTIIQTYRLCRRKRQEFLRGAYRGFVPSEEVTSRPSLLRDEDPWIKQQRRESNNDASDDVIEYSRFCRRPGCQRQKATRHARSGKNSFGLEFCSVQCAEYFYQKSVKRISDSPDYDQNMMVALELSRIQMIQREGFQDRPNTLPRTSRSDEHIFMEDQQLNMAIELSLKESKQLSSRAMSTDGAELRHAVDSHRPSVTIFDDKSPTFIKEASETVSSFLKSLALNSDEERTLKDDNETSYDLSLKRSQSTGDIEEDVPSFRSIDSGHDGKTGVSETTTTTAVDRRLRFVRQKSFEIDSDSTEGAEGGITGEGRTDVNILEESKFEQKNRKCPGLTIQIIDQEEEVSNGLMPNKSPTIHISGVSISRTGLGTPVNSPRTPSHTPSAALISAVSAATSAVTAPVSAAVATIMEARQHRSSSLIVPGQAAPPKSPGSRSLHLSRASSPAEIHLLSLPATVTQTVMPISMDLPPMSPLTSVPSPHSAKSLGDRFTFPATSAGAPLSSVLHVQDCYLSSDDFHEALFLEKSPKSAKKRRKSKSHHKPIV